MAMGSALLQSEHQRVALAISRLGGRAREWALTCGTSVDAAFPTWDQLKQQLSRVFTPPNQAYRIRSKYLATRQGKKELLDYVQELRTLIAGMAADPLPELVSVTVFMEGLRVSAARTEVFRVHPNSFEEAVNVALNAEHKFRSARPGWSAGSASSSSGPEPMDLSYAEDEEAELVAAEQRAGIRRCFVMYGDAKVQGTRRRHLRTFNEYWIRAHVTESRLSLLLIMDWPDSHSADHLRYEPSVAVGMSSLKTQRPLEGTFTVWDKARTVKDAHATVQTTLGMQEDP
ncbi:hypothetical protein PInf_010866 [Phytophthora infestans]|nr:hypothetical protein PInf_010866 [Phytophthora infestans]